MTNGFVVHMTDQTTVQQIERSGSLSLEGMQTLVGGYIQITNPAWFPGIPRGVVAIVDEEGFLKEGKTLITVSGVDLMGPILFVKAHGSGLYPMNKAKADQVTAWLGKFMPVPA
jgi:hypothetical protein